MISYRSKRSVRGNLLQSIQQIAKASSRTKQTIGLEVDEV